MSESMPIQKPILTVQNCPMLIPHIPDVLTLPIVTYWNGTPCTNTRLHGMVTLGVKDEGLCLTATLPHQECPSVPATPPRTRVVNLWEYDVVECFIAGAEGYLEVDLGAGGHFLVLDFAAPRVRRKAYEAFVPRMVFEPVWRESQPGVPASISGLWCPCTFKA